jgi:hypothetical protein
MFIFIFDEYGHFFHIHIRRIFVNMNMNLSNIRVSLLHSLQTFGSCVFLPRSSARIWCCSVAMALPFLIRLIGRGEVGFCGGSGQISARGGGTGRDRSGLNGGVGGAGFDCRVLNDGVRGSGCARRGEGVWMGYWGVSVS